jgi:hypothetical protein
LDVSTVADERGMSRNVRNQIPGDSSYQKSGYIFQDLVDICLESSGGSWFIARPISTQDNTNTNENVGIHSCPDWSSNVLSPSFIHSFIYLVFQRSTKVDIELVTVQSTDRYIKW